MKNKNVGFLVIGMGVIIIVIILIFNIGVKDILSQSCSHGTSCVMYGTLRTQTYFSLAIAGLVLIVGLFLIFSKPEEKIILRKIKERKKKLDLSGLDKDEKEVIKLLEKENGAVFQSSLMERLEIGKVKVTRMLDKLEAKGLVERKRRGMNNIVVLKHN